MAAGFEYFASTDVGAPVLTGQVGKLILVLDWVLVTKGGWAKAYTGTNLAAYRSATGNRFYLRVDDTQTLMSRLRGYRAMTAISTGTNLFPATALCPSATFGIGRSSSADATARRYWGVRTNRYVIMAIELGSTTAGDAYRQVFAFGDVPSLCETDTFNTVLMGLDSPAGGQFFPYSWVSPVTPLNTIASVAAAGCHMAATPTGSVNAVGTTMATSWLPEGQTYAVANTLHGASGRMQLSPITINSNAIVSGGSGIGIPRAYLPNVQVIAGVIPRTGIADEELITTGGRSFRCITGHFYDQGDAGVGYACGGFTLETTDTDGAL